MKHGSLGEKEGMTPLNKSTASKTEPKFADSLCESGMWTAPSLFRECSHGGEPSPGPLRSKQTWRDRCVTVGQPHQLHARQGDP